MLELFTKLAFKLVLLLAFWRIDHHRHHHYPIICFYLTLLLLEQLFKLA